MKVQASVRVDEVTDYNVEFDQIFFHQLDNEPNDIDLGDTNFRAVVPHNTINAGDVLLLTLTKEAE